MYVNKIPFMSTTSCTIHFGMAGKIKNEKSTIMTSLYNARGFKIKHILGDGQFECLRKMHNADNYCMWQTCPRSGKLHTYYKRKGTSNNKHTNFWKCPHWTVEIIYNALFLLDCFPHKNGIRPTLSPRTIVTGSTINFDKHFGSHSACMYKCMNHTTTPWCPGPVEK